MGSWSSIPLLLVITILLLDAALAYHRRDYSQASQMPTNVQELLPAFTQRRLHARLDRHAARSDTRARAAQLQRDLRRAGIEPFGWVINQSLSTLDIHDPVLVSRKSHEAIFLPNSLSSMPRALPLIPWQVEPPVGIEALRKLGQASAQKLVFSGVDHGTT